MHTAAMSARVANARDEPALPDVMLPQFREASVRHLAYATRVGRTEVHEPQRFAPAAGGFHPSSVTVTQQLAIVHATSRGTRLAPQAVEGLPDRVTSLLMCGLAWPRPVSAGLRAYDVNQDRPQPLPVRTSCCLSTSQA